MAALTGQALLDHQAKIKRRFEGNKLLAIFMGSIITSTFVNPDNGWETNYWKLWSKMIPYPDMGGETVRTSYTDNCSDHSLEFFNSWEWLMEVVLMLESLGHQVLIKNCSCDISGPDYSIGKSYLGAISLEEARRLKLETTWEALVEYITLLNSK